jgi:hypothetical protein
VALLALAASAPAPAPAAAAAPEAATFALTAAGTSGAVRLRGAPGETVHGAVLVRNVTGRRIVVRLHRADIANAANGNADYVTARVSAAGRWVRLSATTIRLEPKRSRLVAFSIRVPAAAHGGAQYAGIVAVDAADLAGAARDRRRTAGEFTISRINRQALPLTIRLPGPLTRGLALRSLGLAVDPAGAALVLGLRPGGNVLIGSAPITLRVSRGTHTILRHRSTLGQLFPRDAFAFRIRWNGRPSEGQYRVRGVIRPRGAAPVYIDRILNFTPDKVAELARETPAIPAAPAPGLPTWVWIALTGAGALLAALSLAVWRLARRSGRRSGPAAA